MFYFTAQGTRVVNYNIINSNGVKIGSKTSYICNINQFAKNNSHASEETWTKNIRQMPAELERLRTCTDEINLDDIFIIKTYIGHGWKDVARKLLYSDGQIEQFEENYKFRGISEVNLIPIYYFSFILLSVSLQVFVLMTIFLGNLSNISGLETS